LKDDEATTLWRVLYGGQRGLIGVHSALRPTRGPGSLVGHRPAFFAYPERARAAARWCMGASKRGLEAYFCAHLLLARRRIKANAAPVLALWADADDYPLPAGSPEPTAIVESSPGRAHLFWRLTTSVTPYRAEELNRRLLISLGADRSGWDLSQLLRPPGTRNRKYASAPAVRLLGLDAGARYHPHELELALPEAPEPAPREAPSGRALPEPPPSPTDPSRLSFRARALIAHGNAGAGSPYRSRSEADFAVCLAMFGAGYEEAEIRAVMRRPGQRDLREDAREGPPRPALPGAHDRQGQDDRRRSPLRLTAAWHPGASRHTRSDRGRLGNPGRADVGVGSARSEGLCVPGLDPARKGG
jgi:hypothetical protein